MTKKLQSIGNKLAPVIFIAALVIAWQIASSTGLVPEFMLPSPVDVCMAFVNDFPVLMRNSATTLTEAFAGLLIGLALAFVFAVLMDRFRTMYKALYPIMVITQTVPPVAIAPLLVLWMGYDMAPKIALIVIVCFFPVAVGLLNGFQSADRETIRLMRSMGAGRMQIFRYVKIPTALNQFFSGLRIAVPYAMVGGVIAEWLGGFNGLGVYMTKVKQAYSFDKMFAVILLISAISLILMKLVDLLQKKCMPWEKRGFHIEREAD